MDTAIAMSLGGKKVYATDSQLRDAGYWTFGLRCPHCNEPVYWKAGWAIKTHFAHFPSTPSSQDCPYRVESSSTSYSDGYSFKQRPILLQEIHENLIEILISYNDGFTLSKVKILPRAHITPDEIEEKVLNLMFYNKNKNLEYLTGFIYQKKREFSEMFKPSRKYSKIQSAKNKIQSMNSTVSREILSFITSSSNKAILYAIIHFYRNRYAKDSQDMIQEIRLQIIKDIATTDWCYELNNASVWSDLGF